MKTYDFEYFYKIAQKKIFTTLQEKKTDIRAIFAEKISQISHDFSKTGLPYVV